MNSWMGSHISKVIQSWGPPTQITADGAGGHIYIWRLQPIALPPESPATAYEKQQATYRRITIQTHNNSYKINGIVYHWRAQ